MSALTDPAAERVLAFITAYTAGATAPTGPMRVALLTAAGSDTAAGTEVTGGSYARQVFTPGAPATAGGVTTIRNTNLIRFENMPAVTVVAFALYDSAATPYRWVHAVLTTSRTFEAGDPAEFAIGELVITGD